MIGYNTDFDYLFDPQQQRPVCFCERCGREIYTAGKELCEDCEGD